MKTICTFILSLIIFTFSAATSMGDPHFKLGDPGIQSIHAMTFNPEGILFIGDSKGAAIIALNIEDEPSAEVGDINIENIDELIALSLGTEINQVVIQDMAINPVSKNIYLGVHLVDGTPALLKYGDKIEGVNIQQIKHSKISIPNAVALDAEDRRGRPLRKWTVSDIGYYDGYILISGLTNHEFASTLTQIPYPFERDGSDQASLEIFHAAHGQYETHSPIKTFTTAMVNDAPHVIASYTCTPLVVFPLSDLKPGKHSTGRTIAELGNRNTPLDMITLTKDGESYLLMSNSSRAVMKIKFDDINQFSSTLTDPVNENSGVAGIDFLSLPMTNVQQMDKLDDTRVVMIQRKANGQLDLNTHGINRLL